MFSGAVKIADLDDYITPSQECIKPLLSSSKGDTSAPVEETKKSEAKIAIDSYDDVNDLTGGIRPDLIKASEKSQAARVSLNDCLACSGCVTSAETVLIQEQSNEEFISKVATPSQTNIVSISPQARASLALYLNISELEAQEKLNDFFKSINVHYVFDMSLFIDVALDEAYKEFKTKFEAAEDSTGAKRLQHGIPILTSECPGWICYAEKVVGEMVMPFTSRVKSPQQLQGHFIKTHLAETLGIAPESIYHVCVMPCYDKKLESARFYLSEDMTNRGNGEQGQNFRLVDTVLTAGEVIDLLNSKNIEINELTRTPLNDIGSFLTGQLSVVPDVRYSVPGGQISSHGYLEYIFRRASAELFEVNFTDTDVLEYKVGKNQDLRELTLTVREKPVLRFAIAYGFRNIQNLIRKLKTKTCKYDYVEIMACPGGCLNGGGQVKLDLDRADKLKPREMLRRIEEVYYNRQLEGKIYKNAQTNPLVPEVQKQWIGKYGSSVLEAEFRPVEKDTSSSSLKWQ